MLSEEDIHVSYLTSRKYQAYIIVSKIYDQSKIKNKEKTLLWIKFGIPNPHCDPQVDYISLPITLIILSATVSPYKNSNVVVVVLLYPAPSMARVLTNLSGVPTGTVLEQS